MSRVGGAKSPSAASAMNRSRIGFSCSLTNRSPCSRVSQTSKIRNVAVGVVEAGGVHDQTVGRAVEVEGLDDRVVVVGAEVTVDDRELLDVRDGHLGLLGMGVSSCHTGPAGWPGGDSRPLATR